MMKHSTKKLLSGLLAAVMAVSMPLNALAADINGQSVNGNSAAENVSKKSGKANDSGKSVAANETYYVTLDHYGNLTDASMVKSYTLNGCTKITDYGTYDSLRDLSGEYEPSEINGQYTFDLSGNKDIKHFYTEGKTTKPFENLPWDISIKYALNGTVSDVSEIAGKTGMVDILVDIIPNEKASSYAKNNYTMATAALFNEDDITSLSAEGAQIQMLGNIKAVLYITLPGEEQHLDIKVGTDEFSFGGLTFTMFPVTLSQVDDLEKIADDKDKIEKDYKKVSERLDEVLDTFDDLNSDLSDTADNLDTLKDDAKKMTESARPVVEDLEKMKQMAKDTLDTMSPMMQNMVSLKVDLERLKEVIGYLQDDTNDLEDLLKDLSSIRSSLVETRDALETLDAYSYGFEKYDPEKLEELATQLYQLYLYKISLGEIPAGTPYKAFVKSVLMIQGYGEEKAAETADELSKLRNMSETDVTTFDQTDLLLTIIDDFEDSVLSLIDETLGAPTELVDDLAGLIGDVREYRYMLNDVSDLLEVADSALTDKGALILDDIEKLDAVINEYRPDAGKFADDIIKTASAAVETGDDTVNVLGDVASIIRKASDKIEEKHIIRETKNDMSEIIEDTWNDYTGDKNNVLNIDTKAKKESLTDKRNASPESIQVIIRTAEITEDDAESEGDSAFLENENAESIDSANSGNTGEESKDEAETEGFMTRVKKMFSDIGEWIKGLFGGRNA